MTNNETLAKILTIFEGYCAEGEPIPQPDGSVEMALCADELLNLDPVKAEALWDQHCRYMNAPEVGSLQEALARR